MNAFELFVLCGVTVLFAAMTWLIGYEMGKQHTLEHFHCPHTPALSDDGAGNILCYGRELKNGHDETDGSLDPPAGP